MCRFLLFLHYSQILVLFVDFCLVEMREDEGGAKREGEGFRKEERKR